MKRSCWRVFQDWAAVIYFASRLNFALFCVASEKKVAIEFFFILIIFSYIYSHIPHTHTHTYYTHTNTRTNLLTIIIQMKYMKASFRVLRKCVKKNKFMQEQICTRNVAGNMYGNIRKLSLCYFFLMFCAAAYSK